MYIYIYIFICIYTFIILDVYSYYIYINCMWKIGMYFFFGTSATNYWIMNERYE